MTAAAGNEWSHSPSLEQHTLCCVITRVNC